MEKLELKHIVGYLPYKLKVFACYNQYELELEEDCNSNSISVMETIDNLHKPILRPLSDITKEIEVKGKSFVPAEYFWSIDLYDQQAFELYGTMPPYWKACLEVDIRDWDWGVIEKLYEWHFDIHELIKKGLAIDINTIKP